MLKFFEDGVKERYLNEAVIPTYRRRRDVMYSALQEELPDAKTVLPSGAFYFFVDMRMYLEKLGREEGDLASRLLEKKSVAVIPGVHFGRQGENHFRLTFVTEPEQRIVEGISRISEYLFSYIMT
jgi:aspartate aminotransferase